MLVPIMSRRALSFIVGGLGMVIAVATLIGMQIMGSLLADARSLNIAGPGVDILLRTHLATPGGDVVLDVQARGGSKAGVRRVEARENGVVLAAAAGRGAWWGSIIQDKERGEDGVALRFVVPPGRPIGDVLHLVISADYVVAMTSGSTFSNEDRSDAVPLDVPIVSPSAQRAGLIYAVVRSLMIFAAWFGLVFGLAYLFATATGPGQVGETAGIGIVMGIVAGGFLGYWFFARPIMGVLDVSATGWAVLLTALWLVVPLWWAWRWKKGRRPLTAYPLRSDGTRVVDLEPGDVHGWLSAVAGLTVRGDRTIVATRDKARLSVRFPGPRTRIDQLVIEASELRSGSCSWPTPPARASAR